MDFLESWTPRPQNEALRKSDIPDHHDRCRVILENCRDAMADGGRIFVVDQVIPPGNEPFLGKLIDIEMLVMTEGGLERTENEFQDLFTSAGLSLERVIPTEGFMSVLEASKG